jgi:hypothetical protein
MTAPTNSIRHPQAILMLKILPILRRAFDGLLHQRHVFRMNPLQNKFDRRLRGSVVLEDAEGLLRPDDLSREWLPAKAPGMTQFLRFRQVNLASLFGAPRPGHHAGSIPQHHRTQ